MPSLCLAAGLLAAIVPASSFTLAWEHSVEHQLWEEDWHVEGAVLVLDEARIRGSGAGMDPPAGSVLRDGVWHYRAERRVPRLLLSSGGGQPEYRLCTAAACRALDQWLGGVAADGVIELAPCAVPNPPPGK